MDKQVSYKDLILYSYWRSSCAWRVRIVLESKQLKYTYKAVNLLKGEQNEEEYKKTSVFGKIPLLEFTKVNTDGKEEQVKIGESTAIIEFLEEAFPTDSSIYPKDLVDKSKVKNIVYHIACNIHPIQNLGVIKMVESFGKERSEWPRHWITKGFESLEKTLEETSGKYCFGDSVTLADMYLIPQLYNAGRFQVVMEPFKNINKVKKNLEVLDAFVKASPDNQPDAVK